MKLSVLAKGYFVGMALGAISIFAVCFFHPDSSEIGLIVEPERQMVMDRHSGEMDVLLDSPEGYAINESISDFHRMNIGDGRLWKVIRVDDRWLVVFINLLSDKWGRGISDVDMVYIYDIKKSVFIGKFKRPPGWYPDRQQRQAEGPFVSHSGHL
jgi:hypothetical protein